MKPIPGKTYAIACFGPLDYNRYGGLAICTGKTMKEDGKMYFSFDLPNGNKEVYFCKEEIICEAKLP